MNGNNYVVKANKLIEAKGRLGTTEQKLFLCLISEIQPNDEDFKEYNLRIKDIAEFAKLESHAIYKLLKNSARKLRQKEVYIEEFDEKGKPSFLTVGLISSAKYKKGLGEITMRIDPDLKPYLLALNGYETPFTKYMVKNILKLHSQNSIRIYENLKRFEGNWAKSKKYKIEELKELLGIKKTAYKRFYDFEKRVLDPSKEEINANTDIVIDYKKIKKGRSINEIEFTVFPKETDKNSEMHQKLKKAGVFDYDGLRERSGLKNEKFSDKQVAELYGLSCEVTDRFNGDPEVYLALSYTYSKIKKPKAMFAYLKKALEQNFVGYNQSVSDHAEEYQQEDKKEESVETTDRQIGLDELKLFRNQLEAKEKKGK